MVHKLPTTAPRAHAQPTTASANPPPTPFLQAAAASSPTAPSSASASSPPLRDTRSGFVSEGVREGGLRVARVKQMRTSK